ncbi:MAG: hypothetical protein LBU83_00445, partial [Bacteroidales bacterium]|nr:hypothetical protein [Bacteroidales bacterium]
KTINLYISSVCVDPKISTRGQILRLLYEELIFLMFDLSLHKKIKIGKIFGEDSNVDDCTRIHQNFDLLNSKYDKYKKKIKSKNGVLFEINLDKLECEMDLLYNFLIK